jgi:hypothetical protein
LHRNEFWRYPSRYVESNKKRIGLRQKIVGGNRLHRDLWSNGLLDKVIDAAPRVVLVTCRNVDEAFCERYGKRPVVLEVPPESNPTGHPNDHLDCFGEYRATVFAMAQPGDLWLVGAGVLGKVYCVEARSRGAVALDIGSVFDGWAGQKTRSYLRKEDYKLNR